LIRLAKLSTRLLDANFAKYLTRLQISREQIDEEVFGFHGSFAVWTNEDHVGIECENRGRPVAGGIRVSNTAADCAFVSYLHIANALGAFRQKRTDLFQQIGGFELIMRGRRSDQNLIAF